MSIGQNSKSILDDSILYLHDDQDLMTVQSILLEQQADWNQGDIDGFMEAYWKSEKLLFSGANGITYGWQNTLDGYKNRYPDKATMGKLTFRVKKVEKLSRKAIMLIGSWDLKREIGDIGGHFMLIWKKIGKNWMIVADHTSSRK